MGKKSHISFIWAFCFWSQWPSRYKMIICFSPDFFLMSTRMESLAAGGDAVIKTSFNYDKLLLIYTFKITINPRCLRGLKVKTIFTIFVLLLLHEAWMPIKSLKLSSEGFYSSPVTSALLIQCSGFLPFNWAGQVVYWNSKKGSQCQILESC